MKKTNEFETLTMSMHKKKTRQLHITYTLIAMICLVWLLFAYFYHQTYQNIVDQEYKLITRSLSVKTVKASIQAPEEMSMKEWVRYRVEQEGLDFKDVDCLIRSESSWNEWAMLDNKNGAGVDRGLYQLSSLWHPEISNEVSFNYKKATEAFIKIVKHDGNYHQWHGYTARCK